MRSPSKILVGVIALLGMSLTAQSAKAGYWQYTFTNITTNGSASNNALVENGGIVLRVSEVGTNQVQFTFKNQSTNTALSLKSVYFDDGTLLGISHLIEGPGVNFATGGNNDNFPGGNNINFTTTAGFFADVSGGNANAVQSGEYIAVVFNLINGKTYADTIAALEWGLAHPGDSSDGLRVGIHVGSLPNNPSSQSFINGDGEFFDDVDPNLVPAPAGIVLLATAIPVLGLRRVLRRKVA